MAAKGLFVAAAMAATAVAAPLVEERQNCASQWYAAFLLLITETAQLTSPQATMRRTGLHRPHLLRFGQRLHLWQQLVLAVPSRQRRPVVVVFVGPAAPRHLADQQLVDPPRHLGGREQQQQHAHHHGHADGLGHGHAQPGARRRLDDGQLHGQPL